MTDEPLAPIALGPNQPIRRPYRGGAGIARLRGVPQLRDDVPEDFVASTTETAAGGGEGLTVLADGRPLRAHIRADPAAYLGPEQVDAFGPQPALLVKLLDTAERLFVHFHPDDDFASRHLGCRFGKTEAWYVVATEPPAGADVYLGFRVDVSAERVRAWVEAQDVPAMLAALNRLRVRPGDTVLVPGGLPHAIGPGVTVIELQEPTDFSLFLEWAGYGVTATAGHLGLGFDTALTALDRSAWPPDRLAGLLAGRRPGGQPGVSRLFPPAADRYFRAEHLTLTGPVRFGPEFAVLVVLSGSGELATDGGQLPLRRGSVVLIPYGAGPARLAGTLDAVRCLLPEPS
ncbi:MAG: mannose-6-phosphate isomerase [Mycobacteriales bacterium]